MSFSNDGQGEDLCNDGKSLRNSMKSRPYLHIPNFSNNDVGIYRCESAFKGGIENYEINVANTVRPTISAWLERENNKMVAVCTAERGKPAANISWSHTGNSPPVETLSESHGFFTAESRLELTEGVDVKNLSCAVSHPYWTEEQILVPKPQKGHMHLILRPIIIVSVLAVMPAVRHATIQICIGRMWKNVVTPLTLLQKLKFATCW
ncbi:hypothetical protein D5F01_LYC01605 [Larimichthys crocea]|uniref:Ig-like domain-containing protein n=1 Tax=Larimichthys crocea TaxID=215358 RepID=A0A6G0J6X6_LARCR|nr:hypothetical protein D5F01_LYC01605 [Larimichthys crocea]